MTKSEFQAWTPEDYAKVHGLELRGVVHPRTSPTFAERDVVDAARLRIELDFLTRYPDLHNQGDWAQRGELGYVACLAGWTVIHAGYRLSLQGLDWPTVTLRDGNPASVHAVAAALLGVDSYNSAVMFSPHKTLSMLWSIAAKLTYGEVTPTPTCQITSRRRLEYAR